MSKKETIVFTNGCFDLLHPGHIYILQEAKKLGDKLIVGLNSDESFRKVKNRNPIIKENDRKLILESLKFVDKVIIFNEERPDNLIRKIKPDILVKGSDWANRLQTEEEILKQWNGKVVTIKRKQKYSTTNLINQVKLQSLFDNKIRAIYELEKDLDKILKIVNIISEAQKHKRCVYICGNGGSAAEAQHFTAELVPIGIKAISLTTDTSLLTALANDRDYQSIFSDQLLTLAQPKDVVILLTTSGKSKNIIDAARTARELECIVVSLTGERYSYRLKLNSHIMINVKSYETTTIQEVHLIILHRIFRELAEKL